MATEQHDRAVRSRRFIRAAVITASAPWFATGLMATFDPQRFFDTFADFTPYNSHFIRDIGTLEVGLSVAVVLAVLMADGVLAALVGFETFQVLHVWSHVLDRDHGGHPASDIALFSLLVLVTASAIVVRVRERSRQ